MAWCRRAKVGPTSSAFAVQWAIKCLKSPQTVVFVQQIAQTIKKKENTKVPPALLVLKDGISRDWWISLSRVSNGENIFYLMTLGSVCMMTGIWRVIHLVIHLTTYLILMVARCFLCQGLVCQESMILLLDPLDIWKCVLWNRFVRSCDSLSQSVIQFGITIWTIGQACEWWISESFLGFGFIQSSLVMVMACCRAAPSHCLNQCWLLHYYSGRELELSQTCSIACDHRISQRYHIWLMWQ